MAIAARAEAPVRSLLRRNAAYRRLWAAHTVSVLGDAVTLVAFPTIAVVSLEASPFLVGVLGAAGSAAWLVVSLAAGVWVDRLPRRRVLVAADVVRFGLVASIPAAHVAGVLTVWQLLAVAGLAGVCSVFFSLASTAYVTESVEPDDLTQANARLELTFSAAQLAGPSAGGGLIAVVGAPLAVAADALSFAVSALFLSGGPRPAPPPAAAPRRSFAQDLRAGVRETRRQPVLLRTTAAAGLANAGLAMTQAAIFLFAFRGLGLGPAEVGIAFTAAAVGTLAGAAVAERITRALGTARTLPLATLLEALPGLLFPLALLGAPLLWLALPLSLRFFFGPIWNVGAITLRQRLVGSQLQARVTAVSRGVSMGAWPLGALLGGALGEILSGTLGDAHGFGLTLVVAAAVGSVSVVLVLPRHLRGLPV
ncbi:MAG TPA: MFS transporter [Gaiellaceae bacterium]|nr:MFS transporter [Gaiellaceae bacterium]